MFEGFLWDAFCKCQGVTSIKEDIDPVSSGILAKLMTKNTSAEATFDCIFYSDGTGDEQGAFHSFARFHVDANPSLVSTLALRVCSTRTHFPLLIRATSELFHTLKKNCMPTNFGTRLLSTQSVP